MMTRFLACLAVVTCALISAACGGSDTGPMVDACAEVEGQTYASVEQYECGLGPDGTEQCNWTLYFSQGAYEWSFSDIVAVGDYTCDGPVILGTSGGTDFDGYLDGETGILTWNQIEYQLGAGPTAN